MRTCPECQREFPDPKGFCKRANVRAVWTCDNCYKRAWRRARYQTKERSQGGIVNGVFVGEGPKRASPETKARLKDLFRRDFDKVIHRLCDLMEGFSANEKLKAIATGQGKGGRLQTDCA